LKEGDPCGNDGNNYKCCDGLTCMYASNGKKPSLGKCHKR